jgi:hypothetical protein
MTSNPVAIPSRDKAMIFAILGVFLGGIAYATYGRPSHIHPSEAPTILAGLPTDAAEANATFRARVLSDFPLLSPESNLVQTLSRQGFTSDGWFAKRLTFRRQRSAMRGCDFTASVTWESDDRARISEIESRFLRTPGCVEGF